MVRYLSMRFAGFQPRGDPKASRIPAQGLGAPAAWPGSKYCKQGGALV